MAANGTGIATFAEAVTAFGGPAAFGKAIGWGVGRAGAIARTGKITLAEIQAAGITLPVARYWRNFTKPLLMQEKEPRRLRLAFSCLIESLNSWEVSRCNRMNMY